MRVDKRARSILAIALLAAMPAQAEDDAIQWYAVELVIFDQRGAVADDGERWLADPPLPTVEYPLVSIADTDTVPAFAALTSDERQLEGVRRQLANTGGYEIISHVAWRQPGLARDAAPAVVLPRDWRPPAKSRFQPPTSADGDNPSGVGELAINRLRLASETRGAFTDPQTNPFAEAPRGSRLFGSLRAYRERYLHLQIDLRFSPEGWVPADTLSESTSSGTTSEAMPAKDAASETTTQTPSTYVVRQERRLRSGEIHYLDHPVVGMIATIEPVPAPEEAATLPTEAIPED